MTKHALERLQIDLPTSGVIAVHQRAGISTVLDDLVLVATCGAAADFDGRIYYLPLR